MQTSEWLTQYLERYREDADYLVERLLLSINEQIVERMESSGLRRSEIAGRMGVSRPFVTQLLRGNPNITLKTLVRLAGAVDLALDIRLTPRYLKMLKAARPDEAADWAALAGGPQAKAEPDDCAIAA